MTDQGRSKKQVGRKAKAGKNANQQELAVPAQHADLVRLVRAEPRKAETSEDVVSLSKTSKAAQLQLSEDRMSVTGHKGFRTVRSTHGVPGTGTYYCEFIIAHTGATGHVRLGESPFRLLPLILLHSSETPHENAHDP